MYCLLSCCPIIIMAVAGGNRVLLSLSSVVVSTPCLLLRYCCNRCSRLHHRCCRQHRQHQSAAVVLTTIIDAWGLRHSANVDGIVIINVVVVDPHCTTSAAPDDIIGVDLPLFLPLHLCPHPPLPSCPCWPCTGPCALVRLCLHHPCRRFLPRPSSSSRGSLSPSASSTSK